MNIENQNKNAQKSDQPDVQQLNQRIWVKDQEVNALKVQNRHLIAKLEEAEKNTKPTQQWAHQISSEVQNYLQPVVNDINKQSQIAQIQIEKSLTQAFEMIQGTLRGVYQQSQRVQDSVGELATHSGELEKKIHEQRKADQIFFQEKIFSSMQAFCDRLERQIEGRLSSLSAVEVMNVKVNEMLSDIQAMKAITSNMGKNSELNRQDFSRVGKDNIENSHKLTEIEIQSRNMEEIIRDALQQIQNHRTEFKILRGEMRSIIEHSQRINEKVNHIDERLVETANEVQVSPRDHERLRQELKDIDAVESIEDLIAIKNEDIHNIQSALETGQFDTKKEDLGMILELLRTQKSELKKVAKEAEIYLRNSGAQNSQLLNPIETDELAENDNPSSEANL